MDLPILLSVCETISLNLKQKNHNNDWIFFVENANIHIKVFPKVETREGQDYINIDRVRARFTTTKWVYWYIINSNFYSSKWIVFLFEELIYLNTFFSTDLFHILQTYSMMRSSAKIWTCFCNKIQMISSEKWKNQWKMQWLMS